MRQSHSFQYDVPCVIKEDGDTAQDLIDYCKELGAFIEEATENEEIPEETETLYCINMRGVPEVWTELAIRRNFLERGKS